MEVFSHVVPKVVTAHGSHQHIDCLYDLRNIFVLFDFTTRTNKQDTIIYYYSALRNTHTVTVLLLVPGVVPYMFCTFLSIKL